MKSVVSVNHNCSKTSLIPSVSYYGQFCRLARSSSNCSSIKRISFPFQLMSEYQLYEFQSLDRVLTAADKAYLERLSSRAELTATSARFNYSYGDFRGKPAEVLECCFDIMLYQANFGITQLMIRLPKEAAVPELYEPYCVPYAVSVEQTDRSTIIDISISSEEGRGWIGEEGNLSDLVQIRAALM